MKNVKRFLSLLLSAVMLLAVAPAALAAEFTDVSADVWYADAVNYVTEHNLMDPAGSTSFAPDAEASRAALAVALYRAAGSPAVGGDISKVPLLGRRTLLISPPTAPTPAPPPGPRPTV